MSCTKKNFYPSHGAALFAAERWNRALPAGARKIRGIHFCQEHRGWHLTSHLVKVRWRVRS